MIAETRMQRTGAWNVREQVLHLVGQNTPPFEVNIFCVVGCERYCYQLHVCLLRRTTALEVVAAPAGSSDITPLIAPALGHRRDVISSKVPGHIAHAAIETQVRVSLEKRTVIQRWNIAIPITRQTLAGAVGRDDGIDIDAASRAAAGIVTAKDRVKESATVVRYLLGVVETHRFAVVNPLERHSRNVSSENLLRNIGCESCEHIRPLWVCPDYDKL